MGAWRIPDLHAYVDDCLDPDERQTFEEQMAQDPALARRAALWQAQNSAIRTAFHSECTNAFSISIVRHQNEVLERARRSTTTRGRPPWDEPTQKAALTVADASGFSPEAAATDAFRPRLLWRLVGGALFVCLFISWTPTATVVPTERLGKAGVAAFQAFARPGVEPVEFATSDRTEAQAWLTARLLHPVTLSPTPSAIRLLGARIAPYPESPAAFLLYKSRAGPVGLLVQSLDAPATSTPQLAAAYGRAAVVWTWHSQGFALVGDLDSASLLKIATDLFDPPVEAPQTAPERGW